MYALSIQFKVSTRREEANTHFREKKALMSELRIVSRTCHASGCQRWHPKLNQRRVLPRWLVGSVLTYASVTYLVSTAKGWG